MVCEVRLVCEVCEVRLVCVVCEVRLVCVVCSMLTGNWYQKAGEKKPSLERLGKDQTVKSIKRLLICLYASRCKVLPTLR